MREFHRHQPRGLRFRLLLVAAGALLLMTAFAPSTNAALIAYYNFEDSTLGGPPDFTSEGNIAFYGVGSPNGDRPITTNYPVGFMGSTTGFTNNRFPTDPDPQVLGLGLDRTGSQGLNHFDINLNNPQALFSNMTVSFAVNSLGNGFHLATISFSTDGGTNFTSAGSTIIPTSSTIIVSQVLPAAANNTPLLTVRITLTGGQSNDPNFETTIDNIRIEGAVPEPATVAGGLLGVLGLCWFQRRRLIRSVRLLRT